MFRNLLYLKGSSAFWEFILGINTRGIEDVPEPNSYRYQTISYPEIFAILKRLCLEQTDVFVDLGCGKGRVVCCASQLAVSEVIGVEMNKCLSDIAKRNAQRIHKCKSVIKIINEPAEVFDYRRGSVFYLYNPFGAQTLGRVLELLKNGIELRQRKIRIVYVNPVHESVLNQTDWLTCYEIWKEKTKLHHYKVSFWCSKEY